MTDSKAIEMTQGQPAKLHAVAAFFVEEYRRVGYLQRDDATTYHRQRCATLLREPRVTRGL